MPPAWITDGSGFEMLDLAVLGAIIFVIGLLIWVVPGVVLRPLFWITVRTIYRRRITGVENIPTGGPVLLLSNHVTYVDWLLIWSACPRRVRFVAWAGWQSRPLFRWFLRVTNSILIDGSAGPKQLVRSLREVTEALNRGEVVCLFPEGALSRGGGVMLPFRRGFERIVRDARQPVPIIPTCLSQLWGSVFSYSRGTVLWKWPERIPYRVGIAFGKAMPQQSTAVEVRAAVQELSAETMIRQSDFLRPVHRQFVRVAARFRIMRRVAWIDASAGEPRIINYLKALVGAICIARWLKRKIGTEQHVGLWLPTTAGGCLANVALTILGRTTVNLNYTAGQESNRFAAKQTGMKTIVSAKRFLSRMPLEIDGVQILHLEDAQREITKWEKFRTMLACVLLPGWILEYCVLRLGRHRLDDIITVIYSSGSTGEPKGVMLSHRNLASNTSASADHLALVPQDRLMGVLPLFHSFGYTVQMWLPLQAGGSSVLYPDPRAAKEIGELSKRFQCTALLGTATFLRFYLRRCDPEDFRSVRVIICGAEKLPPALAKEFEQKFGILPTEGYGCTETTPVAAVAVPDVDIGGVKQIRNKIGTVGNPIPGVTIRTFDPDTEKRLPPGTEGMLWVKGANIMAGYLNRPDMTAKVIKDGWYNTGDIGFVDEDGFVVITGRLSRFAKLGGEMVPLEKVEEDIHAVLQTNDRVVAVTSVPDERKGERLVVLHLPTLTVAPRDIAKQLSERGLPNLWIPGDRDYFPVSELPVLGSGKLDLRRIKDMALAVAK